MRPYEMTHVCMSVCEPECMSDKQGRGMGCVCVVEGGYVCGRVCGCACDVLGVSIWVVTPVWVCV